VGCRLGRTPYRGFQVPERVGRLTVVSRRFIRSAHRAGLPVQVWTVNEEPDMWRLLDWRGDGLISDRPDLAVRVRDAWAAMRPSREHGG
jgi:glycerophosphoryl diester phosphodiesterase